MKIPNWKNKYSGLPDLPSAKLWINGGVPGTSTQEQIISQKLLAQESISKNETQAILDCIYYYQNLLYALKSFNFADLTDTEVDNFLLYIGYAYNYLVLHSNKIELYQTYRLVVNSNNITKEFKHQLSYPPIAIVKNKKLYNRASSPNSTAFYCSESVDAAFKELKPKIGTVVTLGIWIPNDKQEFLSYQIEANPSAQLINETAKISAYALTQLKQRFNPLFGMFLDGYLNVLNHEYSKPVTNPKEYLISSYFSELIFTTREKEWTFDCITYPSVGNEYSHSNLAIKPNIVDTKLKLIKAFEFEVIDTFYDKISNKNNSSLLTIAKVRIRKESINIENDGKIIWKENS